MKYAFQYLKSTSYFLQVSLFYFHFDNIDYWKFICLISRIITFIIVIILYCFFMILS